MKSHRRNVAFKATRMRDSIMEGQDKFVMRELDNAYGGRTRISELRNFQFSYPV